MNPQVGLQGPPTVAPASGGLLMQPSAQANPLASPMGQWSQAAYQMAGSPKQGGMYASVPVPQGTAPTSSSGGAGSAISGTLLGLLGGLAKNPSAVNAIGNLLGLGGPSASVENGLLGSVNSDLAAGTGAAESGVAANVAAGNDSALGSSIAGMSAPVPAGTVSVSDGFFLPDADAAADGGGAALGEGGGDAAAGLGADSGSLGVAGTLGPIAGLAGAYLGTQALGGLWSAPENQADAAMQAWAKSSGATYKPSAGNTNVGQSTFGNASQFATANNPGNWVGANGQTMTNDQVTNAIYAYAKANGLPVGSLTPVSNPATSIYQGSGNNPYAGNPSSGSTFGV